MTDVRPWTYAALFGALWGALEATIGTTLYLARVPFRGSLIGIAGLLVALFVAQAGFNYLRVYLLGMVGWGRFVNLPTADIGSFLEGAFAPLAFLWLVIGYFLQKKELRQNTDAMKMQFVEIQRLLRRARKPIENKAVRCVRLCESLADDAEHDVVGDEIARVHDALGLLAEARAGGHGFAQHIAGRNLGNVPVGHEFFGLRPAAVRSGLVAFVVTIVTSGQTG